MTFADMVLAQYVIERLGVTAAGDLIDLLGGDTPPTSQQHTLTRHAQRLITIEFGERALAARHLGAVATPRTSTPPGGNPPGQSKRSRAGCARTL